MSITDLDRQIQQLKECKILPENEVKELCNKARDIFIEEANVQDIPAPVTVSITFYFLTNINIDLRRHSRTIFRSY